MNITIVFLLLAVYVVIITLVARGSAVGKRTALAYNVADRKVSAGMGGLSLASSWVWATGLFVSALHGYNTGWVGVLWFTVPNTAAILIMLPLALRLRKRYPDGLTLSGYMRSKYGPGVMKIYHLTLGGLAVLVIALNLMAGGAVLQFILGGYAPVWSAILAVATFIYTYRYGLRSSAATGAVQIVLFFFFMVTTEIYSIMAIGAGTIGEGMTGMANVTSFFGEGGAMVALSFGIVTAVGLVAGPLGDPTFWQRSYSYKPGAAKPAFFIAAAAFVSIPLSMSVLGFAAAGLGLEPSGNPDYINLDVVTGYLPLGIQIMFLFAILTTLLSTANAQVIALASLASDYTGNIERQRMLVIGGLGVALAISAIPGVSLLGMFLVYSTLRSSTFLITVTTLLGKTWNAAGVRWGISIGLIIGFPATVYGNLIGSTWEWKLGALGVSTLVPILVAIVWTALRPSAEMDYGHTEGEQQALQDEGDTVGRAGRVR